MRAIESRIRSRLPLESIAEGVGPSGAAWPGHVRLDGGETLVFVTEASEKGPPRLNARTTYRFAGEDAFAGTLELAFDGVNFSPCVETSLHRKK